MCKRDRLVCVIFVLVLALALLVVLTICLAPGIASASEAPEASPTASPSPDPASTLASAATIDWALRWRSAALRARKGLSRVREAFGRRPPVPVMRAPGRGASEAVWARFGKRWRHQCRDWRAKYRAGLAQMRRPGGSGAARWWPLARFVGWPASTRSQLLYVIRRESNGNPRAVNPYSGCAGLVQMHPCHGVANVLDPMVNLRAGLRLWRARGWSPWR